MHTQGNTHPDPGLCEVGPHGYLLPRAHVRVAIPLESGLQFLQLLAGEVSPLPPLPLLFRRVIRGVVVFILDLFFFCQEETGYFSQGQAGLRPLCYSEGREKKFPQIHVTLGEMDELLSLREETALIHKLSLLCHYSFFLHCPIFSNDLC